MCSIAIAGLAMAAVGTGVSVYGQIKAGNARKKQEEAAAKVAKRNEAIAIKNSKEAKHEGDRNVARKRLETLQLISKQKVGMGANGIVLDSGSALDVVMDSKMMGRIDEETIKSNAKKKADAYLQQSENFSSEADARIASGNSAQSAGLINGIASGISGAGSTISNYYSATKSPSTSSSGYDFATSQGSI